MQWQAVAARKRMLSAALLSVSLMVNVVYREGYRVLICFMAIFITIAHTIFFDSTTSYSYYGTAAIASLVMILAVSMFSKSPLGADIQIINLAAILVNMLGYYQYWAGNEPFLYNDAMVFLITAEFIRLMLRTNRDRIHDICEAGSRNDDVRLYADSGNSVNQGGYK